MIKLNPKEESLNNILNTIIHGDSIEVMKSIPDNSIDLIFADPPYNLQLRNELYRPNQTKVDAVTDEWDKFKSFEEYDKFTFQWLKQCRRILKDTGSIWVIGSYHNIFRVGKIMQDLGLWILNDVIWIKTNPMPNFKGTRFNNAHETLIWASKNEKSKYTFNYKSMKAFNDDLQMRSDWHIPICSGNERIKTDDVKLHSTQKPEALLYRIILSTSKENDTILDPFAGSGTTLAMAKLLERKYIGIEKEEKYIEPIKNRLNKVKGYQSKLLDYLLDVKPPKVPFGSLIENKLITPGELLYSHNLKYSAVVMANATLKYNDVYGSIHKVSAYILNKPANNGWDYWYVKRNDKLISINELRNIIIKGEIK